MDVAASESPKTHDFGRPLERDKYGVVNMLQEITRGTEEKEESDVTCDVTTL
jgi:hypothetical protein